MQPTSCRAAIALVAMLALAPHATASPLDLFGFGGRSPALAGTGVATSTDYDAVYLNPAGLADAVHKRITLGTMGGDMFLYRDGERADTDGIAGMIIGGAVRLPLGGRLRDRVGLGLGFHIPTAAINRARHPLPGVPVHVLLESRTHVVAVQGALGMMLDQRWRVGIGVLALAELRGSIDVTTDAAGRFTTDSEQQLVTRFAPIAGARYLAPERGLAVGLTVRGVSRSDYDILVTNDLGDSLPLTIPTVRIAGASQYDPLTVALEGAWQWRPRVRVSGQLAYQRWSAYPPPTLTPVEGAPDLPPPGFHDIVVPRVAVEWLGARGKARMSARGGYAFVMSPAPANSGEQSLLDNHRHVLAAGLGLAWPETWLPLSIDAWAQVHALMPRAHDTVTQSMDTSGRVLVGGVTMGVDL